MPVGRIDDLEPVEAFSPKKLFSAQTLPTKALSQNGKVGHYGKVLVWDAASG
jgi:hypothetical protein